MSIPYEHTQRGVLMLVVLIVGAFVLLATALINPAPTRWLCLALAFGLAILAWLFSSLTVTVTQNELRWYFGPGIWTYRLALAEIETVHIVRNHWWNGLGIRMRPGFRLYNVSGLDAVELQLTNGEIRRIGTDDAPGLAAALASK
jgi:hypothetical protein